MTRKVLLFLFVLSITLLPSITGCSDKNSSNSSDFTFAIITDVHADQAHAAALSQLVTRLNGEDPDFVVNLGDLIFEGNTATVAQAKEWFDVYQTATSKLTMDIYNAVGCHDVVGIGNENVTTTDPGYGKGLFISGGFGKDGQTYYSFDKGEYHCIVLDPNELVNGEQVFQIPDAQLQWLEDDLASAGDAPLLVFFSEPTVSWTNRSDVTRILKGHSARFFSGHLHQDIMMTATDFPEQVTAAVSGEWWQGPNPDGRPAGYRLVSVKGDEVESLYKGTADDWTIDPGLEPIVSGKVKLAVKMDSMHGSVTTASYQIDDGDAVSMTLDNDQPWAIATASWDTSATTEGYHRITFNASDSQGSFEKEKEVKVSGTKTVTVSDLNAHLKVYQGSYTSIESVAEYVYLGPLSISGFDFPDGLGFVFLTEDAEGIIVLSAESHSPSLGIVKSQFSNGDKVILKVVPVRMSMAYVRSTQEWAEYFERIKSYINWLPATAAEPRDPTSLDALLAVWGARWLSPNDLTFLSA